MKLTHTQPDEVRKFDRRVALEDPVALPALAILRLLQCPVPSP